MSEIISDIVLSAATFVVGFILGWFALLAFEFVRSGAGRAKDYLARRKLKAPNGKRTNLTTQQWFAVRTPVFTTWFGE